MNILIVEDDANVRRGLQILLEAAGHTCYWAESGDSALRLLCRESIDVVLLDLTLSGRTSGWDFAWQKHTDLRTRDIPLVVITGIDEEDVKTRSRTDVFGNARRIFTKPFDSSELIAIVDSISKSNKKL